jgi:hypothetical protein
LTFGKQKRPAGKEFRDGTVGEALDDLYSDVEAAIVRLEGLTGLPQVTIVSGAVGEAAGSAALDITGSGFLGGSVQASAEYTDGAATANAGILCTALNPGSGGNSITIKSVLATGNGQPLAVADAADGSSVTITLPTGGGGAINGAACTGNLIIAEINKASASGGSALAQAATGAGSDGTAQWVSAGTDTAMTGGTGSDLVVQVQVGNLTTTEFDALSDTSVSVINGGIVAGLTETDIAVVMVKTGDTFSNQGIQITIVA